MARIRLVQGAKGKDGPLADRLRAAGYEVDAGPVVPGFGKTLRADPPAAVLIDLDRGFSIGRDVAIGLRQAKSTRAIPLIFLGGDPEKVERLYGQLPDATYTTAGRLRSAVKRAIANPPAAPVKPEHALAGYSGTPLPKKLGIKAGATVALLNAPDGFATGTLGALPEGVTVREDLRRPPDLIVWFARSRAEVERRIEAMATKVGCDGLWIAWPKQASGIRSDLTQADVRRVAMANGLVDYKVCAIDATWSGLKFARRSTKT